MNKEKGFTLIELLAVIVILAIIMVIAVPKILNVIENSRESAAISSAKLYIDAVKKNNAISEVNGTNTKIEDGIYDNVRALPVNIKGDKPTSGTLTIENSKVTSATLCMNNYKVRYDGNSYNIISKDCSSETVQIDASMVEFTPSDSNWQVTNVKEALDYLYENVQWISIHRDVFLYIIRTFYRVFLLNPNNGGFPIGIRVKGKKTFAHISWSGRR